MDIITLFLSCKRGDLATVKYLVEQREVPVNVRDKWDSTPLYYACLCGHRDLVRFLLEHGARCQVHTFDGERCLYGALNQEIRNILRNFKVVTTCGVSSHSYKSFLQRILEKGDYADIVFVVHEVELTAHRCILCARSEYFNEMFHDKWKDRSVIHIGHPLVTVEAFKDILQFIYTGHMDIEMEKMDDYLLLIKQCRFPVQVIDRIDDTIKKTHSFECTKPGTKVKTVTIDCTSDLNLDLGTLIDQSLPRHLRRWVDGSELPFLPNHADFTDLCLYVDGARFYCHRVFFCSRSEYFRALISDHFMESEIDAKTKSQVVRLQDVCSKVFTNVLYYIYQDTLGTDLTEDIVCDVLCAADMYLLPGLKRLCSDYLVTMINVSNVVSMIKISDLFRLPRLQRHSIEYVSCCIHEVVEMDEFEKLIVEEAATVKNRQEVDSLPIIDDIRYTITSNLQTYRDMEDANDKLAAIDALLEKLGLDG